MTIDIDKSYTTDGKVVHLSKDEEINVKLGRIIGKKFVDYRKKWDAANRFELVTDFPLFLHFFTDYHMIPQLFSSIFYIKNDPSVTLTRVFYILSFWGI